MLKIENLNKTYDGAVSCQALKDISLEVKKGEFIGIVGSSGSGKSTLLNCIAGLDIPQNGKVIVDNLSVYDLTENQRSIFRREYTGLIFQQYYLIPILNAEENVLVSLTFNKDGNKIEKVRKLLKKVGLEGKEKNIPGQLSGGECQRIAIARALINNPAIILADEPTGNLDSENGKQIMELLKQLNKEGKTIILVTHNEKCANYADRIVKLKDGKIIGIETKNFGGNKNGR